MRPPCPPSRLVRIAGLAGLSWALLQGWAPQAQMVFPELLPPNAALVVSVPHADRAFKALRSSKAYPAVQALRMPLFQLEDQGAPKPPGSAPESSLRNRLLFGEILSASEMAIVPGGPGAKSPAFLFLGRVQDLPALRQLLDTLERKLTQEVSSSRNPVTRQAESINQTAVVLLSDAGSTIGYFLNGPKGICAISNDASLLRETARRLEKTPSPPAGGQVPKSGAPSFPEIRQAWNELLRAPGNHEYDACFFIAPPKTSALPVPAPAPQKDNASDSLIRNLQPRGGMAGGLSFGPDSIRMETFALFPTSGSSLMESLYRSAPLSKDLPGTAFAVPDALLLSGNRLFAVPVLKRAMIGVLDQWSARIPQASPSGLNPASARAQAQLAILRGWMNDPAFLAELGPSWFFALNDFTFQKPGEFPRIDLVLGFETREPETTRRRVLALETDVLNAVEAWLGNTPAERNAPRSPDTLTSVSSQSPDALAFVEQTFPLPSAMVRIRTFQMPQLPPTFRPAWTIHSGHLLAALSPESLQSALKRQAEAQAPAPFASFRAESGMENVHAYQVIRLGRAAKILQAILEALAAKRDPSLTSQIASLAGSLEHVDAIGIFRRGVERGVHTVGEIRIKTPSSAANARP